MRSSALATLLIAMSACVGPDKNETALGAGDSTVPTARRDPAVAAEVGTAADLVVAVPGDLPPMIDPAPYHAHADAALQSLLLNYWMQSSGYLAADSTRAGPTGYWTFAQALDAVIDGAVRTNRQHFAGWIEALYEARDAKGWSSDYYDDLNWMTLALLRAPTISPATRSS
jgi:hypothetical protein